MKKCDDFIAKIRHWRCPIITGSTEVNIRAELATFPSWQVALVSQGDELAYTFSAGGDGSARQDRMFDVEVVGKAFLALEEVSEVTAFLRLYGPLVLNSFGEADGLKRALKQARVTPDRVLEAAWSWRAYFLTGSFSGSREHPHPESLKRRNSKQLGEYFQMLDEDVRAPIAAELSVRGKKKPILVGHIVVFDVIGVMDALAFVLRARRQRLRRCVVCPTLFVPKTSRSKACSVKCGTRERTAKWRAESKANFEAGGEDFARF